MSAPKLVLGSVTQGSATTPTTIWTSPDRDAAIDTSVKRVKKFEDQLANCVDMNMPLDAVEVGKIVAVRRGHKFVRGKVEEILNKTNTVVRVLMTDWGEMVEEITDNLRIIPDNIKMPKSALAHRLIVWERGLVEEEVELVKDIVEECRLGWLEGIGQSECGQFVTGKLKVKITPNM